MSAPMLQVQDLCAWYGRAQVLFDVSLSVAPGEVVALLGRNGAGKSTTMKAILGMVSRRAQVLSFDGQDIRALPAHRIARMGLGWVPEAETGVRFDASQLAIGWPLPPQGLSERDLALPLLELLP